MRSLVIAVVLVGCSGPSGEDTSGGDTDVVDGCRAGPGPDARIAVISHPYAAEPATWEVLELDSQGVLSTSGLTFVFGRSVSGRVVFTPDGTIGLAILENGVLGILGVEDGVVEVLNASWNDPLATYIEGVAMHPSGETALLLDPNWRNNGGRVFEVAIDCATGDLTEAGRSWDSKLAAAAVYAGNDEWLISAEDVGASATGSLHLLGDDVTASGQLFPDADVILSSMATHGELAIQADYNAFGVGNRVGVARVTAAGVEPIQIVSNIQDPVDLVFSPDGRSVLVSSGFGDALLALSVDPDAAQPVQLLGEITYEGTGPALPGRISAVPDLSMAFVAENVGVRSLSFGSGGAITDLGRLDLGSGNEVIVGAIGVQP